MAVSGATAEFKIPQEPLPVPPVGFDEKPVPSVSSDDESFVVLGKSFITDFDDLSFEDNHSFGKSIIQEAKQLIKDELDKMENTCTQQETTTEQVNGVAEANVTHNGHDAATSQTFHSTISNEMEHSSVLPNLPAPHLYSPGDMEENINDTSRTISIISFAPSEFASEELQTKVKQLIDENIDLKNTIMQNNMSMKAQYDKIVAWQKDVEKVHEAHKEKFRHAKQCIESLKKENAQLEQEIENLRYTLKLQESEHNKTKQTLTQSTETNLKEFELDIATKKIKELEETIENMKMGKGAIILSETAKRNAMEEKLERYEKELEAIYQKNRELEKQCGCTEETSSYLEKLKVYEEKLRLTELANEQANQEIFSLRNRLAQNLKNIDGVQENKNKLEELEEMLTLRNANLIEEKMRSQKAEENLKEAKEKILNLESAIGTLQGELEENKVHAWKNKQKLMEKETQLHAVQSELEVARKQQYQMSQNPNDITYLRQQLMQSQMALTQCDQNRAVAYAQLEIQKNEIADLRRQIETKQSDTDDMFALRTQLDVYKVDFEAEREAKENIKLEKTKLSEDLQHLHRRNQQLQEETELLREQLKQYGEFPQARPNIGSRQGSSSSASSSPPLHTRYACPICNVKFRSLKLVQDHLDTCICHAPWAKYSCPKCQFGFSTLDAVENHVERCINSGSFN